MGDPQFLFISGHDYRSQRKASVHFFARHLASHGTVRFLSVGYSLLSHLRVDPRRDLDRHANVVEMVDGIEAFLHKTLVHPFRLPRIDAWPTTGWWMDRHARSLPRAMRQWIQQADVVFLETGLSLIYFAEVKRLNPAAILVYVASDQLTTIRCSVHIQAMLGRIASAFDMILIRSEILRTDFPDDANLLVIPQAFEPPADSHTLANPYCSGINAVSVGSMLFDADLFRTLCPAAPEVHFHVIGAGAAAHALHAPNLTIYDEMPFERTRGYIAHADVGIAPYHPDRAAPYLADTSLKLVQFSSSGLPAICPEIVVGSRTNRFGYATTAPTDVRAALDAALNHGRFEPEIAPTWCEVGDRLFAAITPLRGRLAQDRKARDG